MHRARLLQPAGAPPGVRPQELPRGTERYEDHEDDSNCEEESTVEQGNFSNCPGHRQVRKRYQVYKLLVGLEFREPFSDRPPVAEFDGESRYRQRLLETLSEGQCQVY
jgi:hypothetical protein